MVEKARSCKNLVTGWSFFAIDLEAALDHANDFARFIQCGMISQYNLCQDEIIGIRNLTHINRKRIRMEGFIVSDHLDK